MADQDVDTERERSESLLHPTAQAPVDQPDWLLGIVSHIITINHELGGLQSDVGWIKTALKVVVILVIALAIVHGPELWRWILDLVT